MNNKEISGQFTLLSKLMDLHGENSFKVKSYSVAAYKIEQLTVDLEKIPEEKIFQLSGIGEAIGSKILELLQQGHMKALDEILAKTPEGVLEMLRIKGLGPKKIGVIWKEMQIESMGELLYACQENRLMLLKGFGEKTQQHVIESIEFLMKQKGNYLFSEAEPIARLLGNYFMELFHRDDILLTGALARHAETVDKIEWVIPLTSEEIQSGLKEWPEMVLIQAKDDILEYQFQSEIPIFIYSCSQENKVETCFRTTCQPDFLESFDDKFSTLDWKNLQNDREIFIKAAIQYIPPFLYETKAIIDLASLHKLPTLITQPDIRGIIHCHSNWSDGVHSLEALCQACIEKGYEYLVISDHSKSAFYAHGLSEEKIIAQHQLIEELNGKLAPFKIFKSIESDILNDGSLDYSDEILSTFDLVIASIHSNLKMTQEKADLRLVQAIENRHTTILGHMTGRLLLSRKGYPVSHRKIIDACAANNVVIEINAHPRRLDMDWRYLEYALDKGVMMSINPDAHSIDDFGKIRYGVLVAQKGLLCAAHNLSSLSKAGLEEYLAAHRKF